MNKKISVLLLLVMILSIATGCSQPADVEPEAADYKFAIVYGALHPYFDPMPQAAKDAEKDFGLPEVTITAPQNWDQPEQNVIYDGLVAKGYNGIVTMMSEAVAGTIQINKMIDQGVKVLVTTGPPDLESYKGPFYLSTDSYQSAYLATKTVIEQLGGEGNIVHLAGMVVEANVKVRMQAVEKAVSEHPGITLLQTIADLDVVEAAQDNISSLMAARRSEIDGIVSTSYIPTMVLADIMTELDETRIVAVGNDTDPIVMDAIRSGHMFATTSQNPYGQAYLGLYTLKLLTDGYTWKGPEFIDSGTILCTQENVDSIDQMVADVTAEMAAEWKDKYFEAPAN
jgi:ribose transport system substrate-binding protein